MANITGTSGADTRNGTSSADIISGLGGADTLSGLGGNDTLLGGSGKDSLIGGSGNDSLVGGSGADALNGGGGNDTYVIDSYDSLSDSGGIDTVRANFTLTLFSGFENLVLLGGAAIDGTGNASANVITGNGAANRLSGLGGNDTLNGGAGADVLVGGNGADVLIHGAGDTGVRGGAGIDTLRVDGGGVKLDLTAIPNSVHSDIEVIKLTGSGNNLLKLAATDVVAFSTSTNTLRVDGNAGDQVLALDGNWAFVQNVTTGGQTYAVYTKGTATLRVDVDIDRDAIAQSSIDLATLDGKSGFRIAGATLNDYAGRSVSGAGDVNGDGFDDLIVGASYADPNGDYSGASYVVFGKAGGFATSLNLSTLNGTSGFRLEGVAQDDEAGHSVSGAGDVNGDGFDDLIIGAHSSDANGSASGASYVVFGKAGGFASSLDLSALNGTSGFRLEGVSTLDFSGRSVSAADVNGDGFDDLIVGAMQADPNGVFIGATYVVFGRAGGFASSINLSTLNGTTGFRLDGATASERFGQSVSAAGDVNGDGFDDLIVGAPYADPDGSYAAGASYVVFGKASGFAASINISTLNGTTGFRLEGVAAYDRSGFSVSGAGDVNGDGFDDVIIGARYTDPNGGESGASYVVFGKASGFASSIDLSTLNGTSGFRLEGVAAGDNAGISVSGAGDVNGDGFDDLIIGARDADPNGDQSGASYVVFGKAGGFAASIDLSTLNGTGGFRLEGVAADEESGFSVSGAGDLNGDGFDDLIVGTRGIFDVTSGSSYVVYGGNFTGAVTFLGASGGDSLAGTSAAERFVSAQGNDTLTGGGGTDVFNAGAGNDLIRASNLAFAEIDGGSGTDTLAMLGAGQTLNLVARPNNEIAGIERINLTGSGDNTLRLSHRDLFDLSDTTNQLRVDGNAGDTVDLVGTWTDGGAGATYHTYTLGAATILIDNDIFVT